MEIKEPSKILWIKIWWKIIKSNHKKKLNRSQCNFLINFSDINKPLFSVSYLQDKMKESKRIENLYKKCKI
jgi:hypothetical protein